MICEYLTIDGEIVTIDGEPVEFCQQGGGGSSRRIRTQFRARFGNEHRVFDDFHDAMDAMQKYEEPQIRFKPRKPTYY